MDEPQILHNAILAVLERHVGRMHSIERPDLVRQVEIEAGYQLSDREVRQGIEWLRQNSPKGACIMSSSGWLGYWMAKDFDEVLANYKEERSRAINIMQRIRKQRQLAERLFDAGPLPLVESNPQLELFAYYGQVEANDL